MKIQIDLPKNINKELKKYRIDSDLDNMQLAIVKLLKEALIKNEDMDNK